MRYPPTRWIAIVLVLVSTAAWALPKISPAEVAARVNWSPQCTEFAVVGTCYCAGVPCGWRVRQYIPTAFVETTRSAGETLIAALDLSQAALAMGTLFPGHTRQIHQQGMDNTYEAHVFGLPETILRAMTRCVKCRSETTQTPYTGASATTSPGGGALCERVADVISRLASFSDLGGAGGLGMPLYYAGECDALNWRTGCRDLSITQLLASNPFTCIASSAAQFFTSTTDPIATLVGADACIGLWGPNYPRQMRTRGPDQVLSSAVASFRAMSIARTELRSFPYPVDVNGKLQMAYPGVSACARIGQLPLPPSMGASGDGAYGWIYWRPVTCCIPFNVLQNCL